LSRTLRFQLIGAPLPKSLLVKPRSRPPASGHFTLVEVCVHGTNALSGVSGHAADSRFAWALRAPSVRLSVDSRSRSWPVIFVWLSV
jgi:hypothetical protein